VVRWEWKVVSKVEGKEAGRVALSIQKTCLEESCFVTSPGPVTRYQGRKRWKKVFQTLLNCSEPITLLPQSQQRFVKSTSWV
jgi:hypothetical protein